MQTKSSGTERKTSIASFKLSESSWQKYKQKASDAQRQVTNWKPQKKKELERRRNYKRKGPQTKCHAEHTMQHRNEFTPKKKEHKKIIITCNRLIYVCWVTTNYH